MSPIISHAKLHGNMGGFICDGTVGLSGSSKKSRSNDATLSSFRMFFEEAMIVEEEIQNTTWRMHLTLVCATPLCDS